MPGGLTLLQRSQPYYQLNYGTGIALSWVFSPFRSWKDFGEFFLSSDVENIKATDILKLCATLAGSEITIAEDASVDRRRTVTKDDSSRCVEIIREMCFLPNQEKS